MTKAAQPSSAEHMLVVPQEMGPAVLVGADGSTRTYRVVELDSSPVSPTAVLPDRPTERVERQLPGSLEPRSRRTTGPVSWEEARGLDRRRER